MKKQKLYTALALVTLSTTILMACSSNNNEMTKEVFAQSSQTSSSSSENTAKATKDSNSSKTTTTTSANRNNSTSASSATLKSQEVSTGTENKLVVTEQSTITPSSEEILATATQETTDTTTTPVQETNSTDATVPAIDYSYLAGKWRNAAGSEIVYNDKGEVISFDGVAQTGWTPNQVQTSLNRNSMFYVEYSHTYTAVLPAGTEYSDEHGYVSNSAIDADRLLVGNGSIDFNDEQVYFRVE